MMNYVKIRCNQYIKYIEDCYRNEKSRSFESYLKMDGFWCNMQLTRN